jgi:hypothetical protein
MPDAVLFGAQESKAVSLPAQVLQSTKAWGNKTEQAANFFVAREEEAEPRSSASHRIPHATCGVCFDGSRVIQGLVGPRDRVRLRKGSVH